MTKREITSGYSRNRLPYARIGDGLLTLVIFDGLNFNHKPSSGFMLRTMLGSLKTLADDFTIYYVSRKPGLPKGYSMQAMADDYAMMIRDELKAPVDVMGISTGGPAAQYFAVDHPDLVRRLVLASTGYKLSEHGAALQRRVSELVQLGKWRAGAATFATGMTSGVTRPLLKTLFWLMGKGIFGAPSDPSDGTVEIEAEDRHNFKERLGDIRMPTLVIGGDKDFFYPIRETAEGIPNAQLILYKGVGHGAMSKAQFGKDVFEFLT